MAIDFDWEACYMAKPKFSVTYKDPAMVALVNQSDQRTLAIWAIHCVDRVLPYFEEAFPEDSRPRQALETLQDWIDSGLFRMAVIRGASLASHAAAHNRWLGNILPLWLRVSA
jgi:hypothetical protein